jgi:hypothetical protein
VKERGSSDENHEPKSRPTSYGEPIFDASAEVDMASTETANRLDKDTTVPITGLTARDTEDMPEHSTENTKTSGTKKDDSNTNKAVNGEAQKA